MVGRITGGMMAALLLCLAAEANQTRAWNWGELNDGNMVAINKSINETTRRTATATVTESPTWDENTKAEPLRREEATWNAPVETNNTVTAVGATREYTRATRSGGVQQTAWWANEQPVADADPLPRSSGHAQTEPSWLTGVSG